MADHDPSPDPAVTEAARGWIARLASGEIAEAEMAAYRRWAANPAHQAVFQHELALWRSLGAIGDRLAPETSPATLVGSSGRRRWGQVGLAVAASLVALIAGPEVMLRVNADYRTDLATRAVVLPDGSRAVLDAGSAIAVRYGRDERRIDLLRGRAWFDVRHGQQAPFRVAANGGVVEDVGTAFEVTSEAGHAQAAVTSGEVRLRASEHAPAGLSLVAGQRARWSDGGAPARESDVPATRIAAWREGDVLLDAVSIRAAVREIGRYRAGPIFVMGDVDALPPVTAILRVDRPDEGLNALASSAGLQILRFPAGVAVVRPAP